ncbi:hypothetical protein XENTR_v10002546 [Xenopus tropicalis]|nr:hypothetical protein XENTR_v10002546 [Xenopus tropicalis]
MARKLRLYIRAVVKLTKVPIHPKRKAQTL